jgi:hypothetical protein
MSNCFRNSVKGHKRLLLDVSFGQIIYRKCLMCGSCTKQGFCAMHLEFDTSSLKENCKKNVCEQNT